MRGLDDKHEPQPRFRARAKVRPKAQLTLPEEIRRAMHVSEGDEIEFAVHADGTITGPDPL
jgi:antitoxin PrlF